MASREELIRRGFERWNAGARDPDPEVLHPDLVIHSAMTNATYHGYDGMQRWMGEIDGQFEQWRLSVDEFRDASQERLLGLGTIHLRGPGGGVEFDQPVGWLFTFAGERLMTLTTFPDRAQAFAAAGLARAEPESD